MYTRKMDEELECGVRVSFKIFGGKWKLCIIDAINRGIVRPADIQKSIPDATPRVLEMQLAELLAYGIVCRRVLSGYPKKTEYELAPLGKTILPLLTQIDQWGTANAAFVKSKQLELEHAERLVC